MNALNELLHVLGHTQTVVNVRPVSIEEYQRTGSIGSIHVAHNIGQLDLHMFHSTLRLLGTNIRETMNSLSHTLSYPIEARANVSIVRDINGYKIALKMDLYPVQVTQFVAAAAAA
jgi:hypothetical protein